MTEICAQYGVGLSPIREALSRLGTEGLVQQTDRRGFSVTDVGLAELRELVRTRALLYDLCLRQSIRLGDHVWEEALLLAFHRLRRTVRAGEPPESEELEGLHRRFHSALISACGSRFLLASCELLFDQAERYRHLSRRNVVTRDIDAEHHAIMEATIARDEERAVSLLVSHVERTGALAEELLG